jgi:hypothetical protein
LQQRQVNAAGEILLALLDGRSLRKFNEVVRIPAVR